MRARLIISILLVFLPVVSWANGDPVVRFSSVTRSGNPIPMQVADVKIVHEQLTFKPGIPYTVVEVRYTLQNLSNKAIHNLDYGFPIDFEGPADSYTFRGDEITESLYETGWRKEFLRDIAFFLDGKPLEWHSACEIVEKEHQEPAFELEEYDDPEDVWYLNVPRQSRMWTYTQLDIAPGATVDLEVRYSVYHEQTAGYYDFRQSPLSRFLTSDGRVTYDLTPAKHWGDGKAGSIDILLDASRLPKGAEYRIEGLDFVVKDWQWTFHADSFDYAQAPEISLRFGARPPKKGEPFPAWVDIDSFRLPASAYKLTQTETTIDIAFPSPVPVTDISFFNGNPNDADAWEREARADGYKLEIQWGDGTWETREGGFGEVYPYHLFETYKREEAAGDRLFLCLTDVMRQEGNRLVPVNEHEWTWKPGYDNRIRHIRLTVAKLTRRKPTGKNPLSGIRVYAYPRSYSFIP